MLILSGVTIGSASAGWERKADMLFPRGEHANVSHDGKIYVLGGISNHTTGPTQVEAYDPATDRWTEESALPAGRYRHHFTAGASLYNGIDGPEIWICGGKEGAKNAGVDWVDVYNLAAKTWRKGPSLPQPHWAGPAVVVGDKLHVLSGGKGRHKAEDHHFVLDLTDENAGWTNAAPVPEGRVHAAAVSVDGKIFLIGGEVAHAHTGDTTTVQVYDPSTDVWTSDCAALPEPRSHHEWATFAHDGRIISVSGVDSSQDPRAQNSIYSYDPKVNQWTRLADLPAKLASPGAKVVDGNLYVFGGGVNDWFDGPMNTVWSRPLSDLVAAGR